LICLLNVSNYVFESLKLRIKN